MKRVIERTDVQTNGVEVTICDSCGMEAEKPTRLAVNPRIVYSGEDNSFERPWVDTESFQERNLDLEIDGEIDVCKDCFGVLFIDD